jgi:hypothetical protein
MWPRPAPVVMEPVLLGHRAGDVGTSGYVASSTLPHPRLDAVALFEGLCLLIGFDRRPDPFRQMISFDTGLPTFPARGAGPYLSNERQLALSPRKRAAAVSHGREPMVNGAPTILSRECGDSREQPIVGTYEIRSAERCGLGQRPL